MSFNELLKVVVFGVVEGFAEWLPISRNGHMLLVEEIIRLNVSDGFRELFLAVTRLGAVFAVTALYFRKLNPFDRHKKQSQKKAAVILWMKIILGCVPAAVFGFLFNDQIDAFLMKWFVVAFLLVLYGILFIVIEKRNEFGQFGVQKISQLTFQLALYIGLFQVLSFEPGASGMAAAVLGAMFLGCSRETAAEFSLFLSIPIIFTASLKAIIKFFAGVSSVSGSEVIYLLLGMTVSFAVSIYTIKFLMEYIKRNDYKFFGFYRIVLGTAVFVYFSIMALVG